MAWMEIGNVSSATKSTGCAQDQLKVWFKFMKRHYGGYDFLNVFFLHEWESLK